MTNPLLPEIDIALLSPTGGITPNSIGYPAIDTTLLPGVPGQRGPQGPTGPIGPTGAPGLVPTFVMQDIVTVRTGVSRFYFESSRTITKVRASVNTAPVGSALTVALRVNGAVITTVSIAAGTNTATATLSQAVALNDYATIDVTSVGSTTPGSDLIVTLTIN